jgi:hypothetical protein
VALALLGILYPAAVGAAFTGLVAVALGRTGALLSGSAAVNAMRTVDLRQMGGAARRMRMTTAGLLISTAAFSLGPAAAAAWRPLSAQWLALGAGLVLVAVAGTRVAFAVTSGPLRRRRAFEPERVREAPGAVTGAAIAVGLVGLAAVALSFFPGWVAYLDPTRHDRPVVGTYVLSVGLVLLGGAVAAFLFVLRKDRSLALAGWAGGRVGTTWAIASVLLSRYVGRPGLAVVDGVEDVGLPSAEAGLGRAAAAAGGVAGRQLPWITVVAVGAVLLAVVFGLVATGAKL